MFSRFFPQRTDVYPNAEPVQLQQLHRVPRRGHARAADGADRDHLHRGRLYERSGGVGPRASSLVSKPLRDGRSTERRQLPDLRGEPGAGGSGAAVTDAADASLLSQQLHMDTGGVCV